MAAAGIDFAGCSRPSGACCAEAGDWYDVLPLPDGGLLLVVGDIAGHGPAAAAGMIAVRQSLRELAATGAEPGPLLAALNRTCCDGCPADTTGTVICARYSPGSGLLRWARAGHLPPLLVRGPVALLQPLPEGMLLGVDPHAEYEQRTLALAPGDTLLLYTDGLIERRAGSISDALAEFAAVAAPVGADLDAHLAKLLDGAVSDTGDDACLLAARVR